MTEASRQRSIQEHWWNTSFNGTYGRFVSFDSNPVDYFLTNFTIDEIENKLSFAKSLGLNDKLKKDFELMMQRDIDESRVKEEIGPYLREPTKTIGNTVFFPPLLVAIVPVREEKRIEEHYPDRHVLPSEEEVNIQWGEKFALNLLPGDRRFHTIEDDQGNLINVKSDEAILRLKLSERNEPGVKLVVIDGQHRLSALKHVISTDRQRVSNLSLPACIVFPPLSTRSAGALIPSVPTVFRQLFVDVNSNMKQVSGHFSILLGDRSLGDLACRKLCESTLLTRGPEALAVIEWNTKSAKESWNITNDYSLTSIGVIWRALNESIGKSKDITHYLLGLNEIDIRDVLQPPDSAEEDYPSVKWDRFSLPQRQPLEKRIEERLLPFIDSLFFGSEAFREAFSIFCTELEKLKQEATNEEPDTRLIAKFAVESLVEFRPIEADRRRKELTEERIKRFEREVKAQRNHRGLNFIRFAVFQRAVFLALFEIAKRIKAHDLSPQAAFEITLKCVDTLLEDGCRKVGPEQTYTQYLLYQGRRIKPKQATVTAIANLLLAQMANKARANSISANLRGDISDKRRELIAESLHELAHLKGQALIDYFKAERELAFKQNFSIDANLTDDEKEELALAHQKMLNDQKLVREGEKSEEDVDHVFLDRVKEYMARFETRFERELREVLDIPTEFGSIADAAIDDESEEDIHS